MWRFYASMGFFWHLDILGRETLALRKGEKGLSCPYQGGIMVIEVLIFKRKMFTFWKIKWISNKCKIFNDQIWSIVNPINFRISFRSSIDNFILYVHVYFLRGKLRTVTQDIDGRSYFLTLYHEFYCVTDTSLSQSTAKMHNSLCLRRWAHRYDIKLLMED